MFFTYVTHYKSFKIDETEDSTAIADDCYSASEFSEVSDDDDDE